MFIGVNLRGCLDGRFCGFSELIACSDCESIRAARRNAWCCWWVAVAAVAVAAVAVAAVAVAPDVAAVLMLLLAL